MRETKRMRNEKRGEGIGNAINRGRDRTGQNRIGKDMTGYNACESHIKQDVEGQEGMRESKQESKKEKKEGRKKRSK